MILLLVESKVLAICPALSPKSPVPPTYPEITLTVPSGLSPTTLPLEIAPEATKLEVPEGATEAKLKTPDPLV